MATESISIDLEAWERLRRARRWPGESFSKVIKRARWSEPRHTAAELLARSRKAPLATEEEIARLDDAQCMDDPPEARWQSG